MYDMAKIYSGDPEKYSQFKNYFAKLLIVIRSTLQEELSNSVFQCCRSIQSAAEAYRGVQRKFLPKNSCVRRTLKFSAHL